MVEGVTMGIWIRSQNGNALVESTRLNVEEEFGRCGKPTGKFEINGVSGALGMYSSKERALKVLDEIQTMLVDGSRGAYGTMNMNQEVQISFGNQVFQMPKE